MQSGFEWVRGGFGSPLGSRHVAKLEGCARVRLCMNEFPSTTDSI